MTFTFGDVVIVFAVLVIMNWGAEKLIYHVKYRHKWQCPEPGCVFRVSCSHKDLLDRVQKDHADRHK